MSNFNKSTKKVTKMKNSSTKCSEILLKKLSKNYKLIKLRDRKWNKLF